MLFCPHDGNLLLVEAQPRAGSGGASSLSYPSSASSSSRYAADAAAAAGGAGADGVRFYCQTCPYVQRVATRFEKRLPLARKKVDDVLGGEDAWRNVDQTEARCPSCAHDRAFFLQMQIRSADEPATIFFKCVACARTWSSN